VPIWIGDNREPAAGALRPLSRDLRTGIDHSEDFAQVAVIRVEFIEKGAASREHGHSRSMKNSNSGMFSFSDGRLSARKAVSVASNGGAAVRAWLEAAAITSGVSGCAARAVERVLPALLVVGDRAVAVRDDFELHVVDVERVAEKAVVGNRPRLGRAEFHD
jgi:hypothetical protein